MNRYEMRKLARFLVSLVFAIVAALLGHKQLSAPDPKAPVPEQVKGAARAIDGDSLFVGQQEVRLKGIDAPEGRQTCTREGKAWDCGNAARDELRRLIGKDVVVCRSAERDKHGRVLGYCSAGGRDLNAGMVSSGLATAFGGYTREQGAARAARRGLWSGDFQRPQDWRHERGVGL